MFKRILIVLALSLSALGIVATPASASHTPMSGCTFRESDPGGAPTWLNWSQTLMFHYSPRWHPTSTCDAVVRWFSRGWAEWVDNSCGRVTLREYNSDLSTFRLRGRDVCDGATVSWTGVTRMFRFEYRPASNLTREWNYPIGSTNY